MRATKEEMPPVAPRPVYSDIYPLDEFYAERGEAAPAIDRVEPDEVPEPYRSLLDHKTDMTSTLEKFYHETLHIEILARHARETEYCREVVLVLDRRQKRVEFGAIKIFLDLFAREPRQEILRGRQPLGWILNRFNIPFASRPGAFLRLASDIFIDTALQLQGPQLLHGRRNSLVDAREQPLAEIVEILPP
jgi:chorismate-pyruvate lyase